LESFVSINSYIFIEYAGGHTGVDAPVPVLEPKPSPLLLVEDSFFEQRERSRGQGSGVGRAAMSTDGSQAVGRLFWVPCRP